MLKLVNLRSLQKSGSSMNKVKYARTVRSVSLFKREVFLKGRPRGGPSCFGEGKFIQSRSGVLNLLADRFASRQCAKLCTTNLITNHYWYSHRTQHMSVGFIGNFWIPVKIQVEDAYKNRSGWISSRFQLGYQFRKSSIKLRRCLTIARTCIRNVGFYDILIRTHENCSILR